MEADRTLHAQPDAKARAFPSSLKVLVVEDDFGDFDAVSRALRKMQAFEVRVTRAKSTEAARRVMADIQFDVFLIDYNLGDETGLHLLKDLPSLGGSGVPILLTGLLDSNIHEISLQAGAAICICKDDLSSTLMETTLRSALYTRRLEMQLMQMLQAASSPLKSQLALA